MRPIRTLGAVLRGPPFAPPNNYADYDPCELPGGRPGYWEGEECLPMMPAVPAPDPTEPDPAEPGPALPPGFVAPGPTELHPGRWDLDKCLYTVSYGDTYVGLAKTYLDESGARWRELWHPNRGVTPNPDVMYPGQVLQMTAEACDNMRRWLGRGGNPGQNPSQIGPATVGDTARKYWPLALGLAAVGGGLYYMNR